MAVHTRPVGAHHPPIAAASRFVMLAVGAVALIVLVAIGILILMEGIGTDANLFVLPRGIDQLSELRMMVGNGGFI